MTIAVESCDIIEEKKQYCANLPTEVLCSNTTVSVRAGPQNHLGLSPLNGNSRPELKFKLFPFLVEFRLFSEDQPYKYSLQEYKNQYCIYIVQMSKTVRYQRVVCDRQNLRPYCKQFPESNCENLPGQQCEQVPRQVCQPSCVQSSYCNMCAQFASQGGFQSGACQSQTCPNFISSSASSGSPCQPGQNCQ